MNVDFGRQFGEEGAYFGFRVLSTFKGKYAFSLDSWGSLMNLAQGAQAPTMMMTRGGCAADKIAATASSTAIV